MRGSYLLLRGETFHLRMRVPALLVPAIGCSELKLSLYENRKRDAQLKASFLAFHVRAFFADLRQAMKSLSRTEVIQLVDSWRRRMIDRDSLLRRQVEAGMSSLSLRAYGESCEATGDIFAELANQVLPPAYGETEHVQLKGRPLEDARAKAMKMASSVPSDPTTDDWLPLASRKELDALGELARRDLLQTWLPVAAQLYYEKAATSAAPGLALSPEAASGGLPTPAPLSHCPAPEAPSQAVSTDLQGPTLGEAWALYLEHQSTREEAWRGSVPDSARLAWDDFSGLLGEQIPLASIDRALCNLHVVVFGGLLKKFIQLGGVQYKFPPDKIITDTRLFSNILQAEGADIDTKRMPLPEARAARVTQLEQLLKAGKVGKQFEALLLDEAQDYSPREIRVLRQLTEVLIATADPRQRIYDVEDCHQTLSACTDELYPLKYHFRNGTEICRVADGIFKGVANYTPLIEHSNYNENEYPSKVTLRKSLSLDEQAAAIAAQIVDQRFAYPNDLIGVLCPLNDDLDVIQNGLHAAGIGHLVTRANSELFDPSQPVWLSTLPRCARGDH